MEIEKAFAVLKNYFNRERIDDRFILEKDGNSYTCEKDSFVDYSDILGEDSCVEFSVSYSREDAVTKGDWETPDTTDTVYEFTLVSITGIRINGDVYTLLPVEVFNLEKMIRESINFEY